MSKAEYHLQSQPIPEGFSIYEERLDVAGLHFRKSEAAAFVAGQARRLSLKAAPDNEHDPAAIEIHGHWEERGRERTGQLGFVPARVAQQLAAAGLGGLVLPRLLKTYGKDGFTEVMLQILGPKDRKKDYAAAATPRRG